MSDEMQETRSTEPLVLGEDGNEDEEFGDEEFGEDEDILNDPFNPKEVDIQVTQSIMDTLIKRLVHKEIDLLTEFQRSPDLWNLSTQSRLIESLLINLPLPAFYFDANNDYSWEVVDGLQRLSAIKKFVVDKELKLTGVEFLKEYEGDTFDKLPRNLQRRIEESPVTLYLIKPGTPTKMKYSLFNRINTGGLSLKPQEIRHAISQGINNGQASKFLKLLTKSKAFCQVVSGEGKRMSNSELVLRHLAFSIQNRNAYKPSMVKFLDEGMIMLGEMSEKNLERYKTYFLQGMDIAWELFEEHAFRKSFSEEGRKKMVNKPLFETLSVVFSRLTAEQISVLKRQKNIFLDAFKTLMEEPEFYESISKSTANTKKVRFRFDKVNKLVLQYCKEV